MRVVLWIALLSLLTAPVAQAGRRVIGVQKTDKAPLPEGDAPSPSAEETAAAKAKKLQAEKEAAAKKAEAESQARQQELQKQEEAEAAARAKAAEAKKKKAEAEAAKKAAEEQKKKDDAAKRLRAELNAARAERVLVRKVNDLQLRVSLTPGAPEAKAVEEIRLDITRKLKVADSRYGDSKPVVGANLVAKLHFVEGLSDAPVVAKDRKGKARKGKGRKAKGKKKSSLVLPKDQLFRLHALGDAGLYGLHLTMPIPGHYSLKISGQDRDAKDIEATLELYPGQWPPPDWDQERSNSKSTVSGRRRPLGM